jgi:hypothetical protein
MLCPSRMGRIGPIGDVATLFEYLVCASEDRRWDVKPQGADCVRFTPESRHAHRWSRMSV